MCMFDPSQICVTSCFLKIDVMFDRIAGPDLWTLCFPNNSRRKIYHRAERVVFFDSNRADMNARFDLYAIAARPGEHGQGEIQRFDSSTEGHHKRIATCLYF